MLRYAQKIGINHRLLQNYTPLAELHWGGTADNASAEAAAIARHLSPPVLFFFT